MEESNTDIVNKYSLTTPTRKRLTFVEMYKDFARKSLNSLEFWKMSNDYTSCIYVLYI